MNRLISAASLLLLTDISMAADSRSSACAPTATVMRTDYPRYSQELGFGGSLVVGLKLDTRGTVIAARVVRSSGKAAFDHAAIASARRHWRFSVSGCSSTDLAREFEQSVTFKPTRGLPFSGSLDRRAGKRIQEAAADIRCSSVEQTHETTVTSCKRPIEETNQ